MTPTKMLWDGINNAYTSNIVSIINEQTIRDPQDETPLPLFIGLAAGLCLSLTLAALWQSIRPY